MFAFCAAIHPYVVALDEDLRACAGGEARFFADDGLLVCDPRIPGVWNALMWFITDIRHDLGLEVAWEKFACFSPSLRRNGLDQRWDAVQDGVHVPRGMRRAQAVGTAQNRGVVVHSVPLGTQ